LAEVDLVIEVVESVPIAFSEGSKDGFKEVAKGPIADLCTSLFLRAFTLSFGSSLVGSGVLALGKILVSRWRAMAPKSPNNEIWDRMRFAELVLNHYGTLLDNGRPSRKTREGLLRNAISHLYEAWVVADRLKEEQYAQRIEFLMGLCGLMLGDVHTRMLHLDPFIEDANARKLQLETEASEAIEMYAELSTAETSLVNQLMAYPAVKNVFAVCRAEDFHCGRKGKAWTGKGDDPLAKAIKLSGPKSQKIEKIVILLVLKAYREEQILRFETFLTGCSSRTIHRSFRPALGTRR
jgi:hypothetical protein